MTMKLVPTDNERRLNLNSHLCIYYFVACDTFNAFIIYYLLSAFDDCRIQFSRSSCVSVDLCTYGAEVCVFCDVLGDAIVRG